MWKLKYGEKMDEMCIFSYDSIPFLAFLSKGCNVFGYEAIEKLSGI